jgi:hypothetical protein
VLRADGGSLAIEHALLGTRRLEGDGAAQLLFCDNGSNRRRLFGQHGMTGFAKDGFHEHIVHGDPCAVNPAQCGTKAGMRYRLQVEAGGSHIVRLRLRPAAGTPLPGPWDDFAAVMSQHRGEADGFYGRLQEEITDTDARLVQRQAYAGMIWSKQF